MLERVGILAGTAPGGFEGDEIRVETSWGDVQVTTGPLDGTRFFLVPRHGPAHERPPHRVLHRANVAALAACHVQRILAVHVAGALDPHLEPGELVVPDDLVDWTGGGPTFFDDETVHVDLAEPYCPEVRAALLDAGTVELRDGGTYVQTRGPRFETPAEARFLAGLGDVVGMTGAHEATVAREAGLCYGSICLVSNRAGTPRTRVLEEIQHAVVEAGPTIRGILTAATGALDAPKACGCRDAPAAGRLG